MTDHHNDIDAIAALSLKGSTVTVDDKIAATLVPPDWHVHDIEALQPTPRRPSGTTKVHNVPTFITLFKRNASADSLIFGDLQQGDARVKPVSAFTAVLNPIAADGTPGWADWRIRYDCPRSPQAKAWNGSSGQPMPQAEFAEFIENNVADIHSTGKDEPTGADMLALSRTFKVQSTADFSSGVTLQNGQVELTYQENIKGTAGPTGKMRVPEVFHIAIPVFVDGAPYRVKCRLRYRMNQGKLSLWYELVQWDRVVEAAFNDIAEAIREACGRDVLRGEV